MKRLFKSTVILPVYALVLACCILIALVGNYAVTVITENTTTDNEYCIIIDAGHGGVDGGATSCTGVLESAINLEIALRLNDLLHLIGIDTYMIRTEDISIHTEGNTIASKKVSDLKERVRIVNNAINPVLVSIHQNYFSDSRYSGAQVFYANTEYSDKLADQMQNAFIKAINPTSNRAIKKANGIYLMQKISCPGVLIECGFLSNLTEEAKLRSEDYQKKICCVIASVVSQFVHDNAIA